MNSGLKIFNEFAEGMSAKCDTFDNEILSQEQYFKIACFEVIGVK